MAASSAGSDTKARRAFVWIAITAVLLALILTGAWYYLAGRLDETVRTAIARAGQQGIAVTCADQEVFGYPFRLGLHCDRLGIDAPRQRFRATGGALRTAAQIYQPTRVVAELDGPLVLEPQDGRPFDLDWTLAQASAQFWTSGLDRFALVMNDPVVGLALPGGPSDKMARSDHLEVHARRNGDDLDFAVSDTGVKALVPELSQLPLFDTAFDVTVNGAADWLSGKLPERTLGEAMAGRTGTIRTLRVALAGAPGAGGADLSGSFSVGETGLVSGDFTFAVTDPQKIAALVSAISPKLAGIAGSVASGIAFAGRTEDGRTVIRLGVADGNASIGVIPLGRIPPLR